MEQPSANRSWRPAASPDRPTPARRSAGLRTCCIADFQIGRASLVRACQRIEKGPAAGDFEGGQGCEGRASPWRAVRAEPTQDTLKRPAARKVFAARPVWPRCSSLTELYWCAPSSRLAIPALPRIQDPFEFSGRLLAGTIQWKNELTTDEHR
jgi:hypothetical protein